MGIKSFEGKRAAIITEVDQIRVRDCMNTAMILFYEEMSLLEAMEIMIQKKVSGGPVLNEEKKLVGIISEGDCVKQISDSRYYNMPMADVKIKHKMSTAIETIHPDENIFDIANKFLTLKRRRFPVVENNQLLGLVSQKDMLRIATRMSGNHWKK
ncbi:CBS domain-containing protein [Psychroflexus maritimus]|uniref:CBS domain-containing protein n=1 Tax=Psychroflexus maritimus TaxID=2714865 RepID=A0A967AD69_9FLAO|nr:CBS domain-containing protein [Psychroflexus maritimus]NGZ89438.1 CBS domain-containing protein [Psychroflexus maritimus]